MRCDWTWPAVSGASTCPNGAVPVVSTSNGWWDDGHGELGRLYILDLPGGSARTLVIYDHRLGSGLRSGGKGGSTRRGIVRVPHPLTAVLTPRLRSLDLRVQIIAGDVVVPSNLPGWRAPSAVRPAKRGWFGLMINV